VGRARGGHGLHPEHVEEEDQLAERERLAARSRLDPSDRLPGVGGMKVSATRPTVARVGFQCLLIICLTIISYGL